MLLLTFPSKRHGLGKTHRRENACQDQAKEWSPTTWGTGHVGSLQESCSVSGNSTSLHSKPRLDSSLLRPLAMTLLSEVTWTWGIELSILFQMSKIVQSFCAKTQLLFPLEVLPKEKFFLPWSPNNVLRTKDTCVNSAFETDTTLSRY